MKLKKIDKLTKMLLTRGYVNLNQLILFLASQNEKDGITIDEMKDVLETSRTTVVDHLNKLENEGFLNITKDRNKKIFPIPQLSKRILEATDVFLDSYREIIVEAIELKAKEIRELVEPK